MSHHKKWEQHYSTNDPTKVTNHTEPSDAEPAGFEHGLEIYGFQA